MSTCGRTGVLLVRTVTKSLAARSMIERLVDGAGRTWRMDLVGPMTWESWPTEVCSRKDATIGPGAPDRYFRSLSQGGSCGSKAEAPPVNSPNAGITRYALWMRRDRNAERVRMCSWDRGMIFTEAVDTTTTSAAPPIQRGRTYFGPTTRSKTRRP
jgi:hypothetical protein